MAKLYRLMKKVITLKNNEKWLINLREDDIWNDNYEFNSKEEAITYGKENFHAIVEEETGEIFNHNLHYENFYVGKVERFAPSVDTDRVLEDISENAYDELGEVAEEYLYIVNKEEFKLLENKLNKVLNEWLDETNNHPTFYNVVDIEKVPVD